MSKKRTSDESNNDEETNEETSVQRDGNAKRRKLDLLSDTTIEDLPFELLELILVKVVVTEVNLNLAKSVWKEKADLSIDRLRTVCSQWSDILATKSFRTKLHRSLDNTAQTIRVKPLHQFSFQSSAHLVTTLKDDIFTLHEVTPYGVDYFINVCDRNDVGTVKKIISVHVPLSYVWNITGCNVSNCVYISVGSLTDSRLSVFRIARESGVEEQFKITQWKSENERPIHLMRISTSGSLLILSRKEGEEPPVVSIYHASGSLQREVTLPQRASAFTVHDLLLKSNGNLVVAYYCDPNRKAQLMELDTSGCVIRQFQSSLLEEEDFSICLDINDGIAIPISKDDDAGFELLDSEFNLLARYIMQRDENEDIVQVEVHYDNEKNEIALTYYDVNSRVNFLTIFRLTVA